MTPLLTAYGHSWVDSAGSPHPDSFVGELAAHRLRLAIRNEGVAGSLSTGTALLVRHNPPPPSTVFLLMTGLNDVRLHGNTERGRHDYAQALQDLFGAFAAASPRAPVIALEQPHLRDYSLHAPHDRGSHAGIDAYNAVLRQVSGAWPCVGAVPVRGWCARTMLSNDAVHPNWLGHTQLAQAVVEEYDARRPSS